MSCKMTDINSICIVRLSALGDVLMMVPLIRTLQAQFPKAIITWVISSPAYDLVEGLDGVEFIVIKKPNGLRDYWQFRQDMRMRSFDVLLAAQSTFRTNFLYPLINAKRKIGYDSFRSRDGHGWFVKETIAPALDHTLEGFLRFADVLGACEKKIRWDLFLPDDAREWAQHQITGCGGRPIILVNPAASKPERSWPVSRYIEVIRYVQSRWHAHVILTGGPGAYDKSLSDAIVSEVAVTNLVGKTKPKQLLALIEQADLMLCPDTGPSHMATAVSTPVIALHAVTSAEVSGPYTYRHLAVDCYPEAIKTVLKSTREKTPWGQHAQGDHTMQLVSVEAVLKKLELVFM